MEGSVGETELLLLNCNVASEEGIAFVKMIDIFLFMLKLVLFLCLFLSVRKKRQDIKTDILPRPDWSNGVFPTISSAELVFGQSDHQILINRSLRFGRISLLL